MPGIDKPHVHWAPDAESGRVKAGDKILVVGASSVGTEAAITLAMNGKQVAIIDIELTVSLRATGAEYDLLQMCGKYNIERNLGWKLQEIKDDKVIAENVRTGEKREFEADTVLLAAGMKPRRE